MTKIELKHVSKTIHKNEVLHDISFMMESGKIYGFQGVNGSGKTMLMRIIIGLIHPTNGSVEINGKVLGRELEFPESIGFLLENPAFLDRYSGYSNLKLLAEIQNNISDAEIKEVLSLVGLNEEASKKKYRKYSLGMKQRLGIAAAIMENPDINERYTEINDPLLPISLTIPTSPLKSLQEKNNVAAQVVAQTVAEHYKKSQQQFKDTHNIALNTDILVKSLSQQIELQKKIIEHLESANAKQSAQLDILHNLFASNEDQAMVAKAIMRIMQTQLDETSPIKNLIIDKGLDFLIAMLPALVTYLKNQGICL